MKLGELILVNDHKEECSKEEEHAILNYMYIYSRIKEGRCKLYFLFECLLLFQIHCELAVIHHITVSFSLDLDAK